VRPDFVLLSTQIPGQLISVVCPKIPELLKTAEGAPAREQSDKHSPGLFKLLTLTTPVSTARTICSSACSEAPGVVC